MTFTRISIAAALVLAFAAPAAAHINLLSPKPLLNGKAMNFRSLKEAPFGAPGVDVTAAPATRAKSGGTIDIAVEIYVFHPGEIVISYTRDFTGADVTPVTEISGPDTPIPHANMLFSAPVPPRDAEQIFRASVPLPEIEGTIILVVRQVMRDKLDPADDGGVSLKRVYYHQAAKLELSR